MVLEDFGHAEAASSGQVLSPWCAAAAAADELAQRRFEAHIEAGNSRLAHGEALMSCLRALQTLVEQRSRWEAMGRASDCSAEVHQLQQALLGSAFSQAFDPALIARILPASESCRRTAGCTINLGARHTDALYILLSGKAVVESGPKERGRSLMIHVDRAVDLAPEKANRSSDKDVLDPYVVVRVGNKTYQTPTLMDAGANPVWDWSQRVPYEGEKEIEFTIMEYDEYSRDDVLGVVTLHYGEFERDGFDGQVDVFPPQKLRRASTSGFGINVPQAPSEDIIGTLRVRVQWSSETTGSLAPGPALMGSRTRCGTDLNVAEGEGNAVLATTSRPRLLSESSSPSAHASVPKRLISSKACKANAGEKQQLTPGCYFGAGDGGGVIRIEEDSEFIAVPRSSVSSATQAFKEARRVERDSFLREFLPGAKAIEHRLFEGFAGTFQYTTFPRGHVLVSAGALAGTGDPRKVYMVQKGTCRLIRPPGPKGHVKTGDEVLRNGGSNAQVTLVGKGFFAGFASSLFSVPEPFTVIADEPITCLWVSVAERPVTSWPREVTHRLLAMLQMRTDWYGKRTQHIEVASQNAEAARDAVDRTRAVPGLSDSPFLKHKDTSSWQMQTLKERFEGWSPVGARSAPSGGSPGVGSSNSLPNLHCGTGASTSGGSTSSFGGGSVAMSLQQVRRAIRPQAADKVSATRGIRYPNLDCQTDWEKMCCVASSGAMAKMYRQQVRTSSVTNLPSFAATTAR